MPKKEKIARPLLVVDGPHLLSLPGVFRQYTVSDERELKALKAASTVNGEFVVVIKTGEKTSSDKANPQIGCVVKIVQDIPISDTEHKVILHGKLRCLVTQVPKRDDLANCEAIDIPKVKQEMELAIRRSIDRLYARFEKVNTKGLPVEVSRRYLAIEDLSCAIDYLALNLVESNEQQLCKELLEEVKVQNRAKLLLSFLARRVEQSKIERKLRKRVKKQMENTHKEFHLSEQAKAIQQELEGDGESEFDELRSKVEKSGMPEVARKKCNAEISKLANISPSSPESSVLRTYIDTLLGLPWKERSESKIDILAAKKLLDENHYGLDKVKDRIMEYLAIQRRVGKPSGTVMCFVGPPGVGKTSLGKSIAKATGREYIRISLGGVHEEAAIRGHRKTYVASMPGRILKAMARAKVKNPVFVLDEFDKLVSGSGFYGDPAAALLEVLDPEQNKSFTDQYVEVEFDLSEVMFITTANEIGHLPAALADRLEIISIPGYTDGEKLEIAKRHLIESQLKAHGLKPKDLVFSDNVLTNIIRDYTHEAGVRELERNIAKICRKITTQRVISSKKKHATSMKVSNAQVEKLLEVPDYYATFRPPTKAKAGYATGLIYGRGVFPIEAVIYDSKTHSVDITGVTKGLSELNVLTEVSLSLLKSRAAQYGLDPEFSTDTTVHLHLQQQAGKPYGALGVCLFTLIASAYTKNPIRPSTALVGEINLRGDVISSEYYSEYKATVMDAQRNRIKRIIMPHEDARLIEELPSELKRDIEFVLVSNVNEVLQHALTRPLEKTRAKKQPRTTAKNPKPVIAH